MLLDQMKLTAREIVTIVTPNGFMKQSGLVNKLQQRLSGWKISEFQARGFRVIGLHGWRALREGVSIKYRPRWRWGLFPLNNQVSLEQKTARDCCTLNVL